jgi:hypothetical protein
MAYETTYGSLLADQEELLNGYLEMEAQQQEQPIYDIDEVDEKPEEEEDTPDDYEMLKSYYEENEARSGLEETDDDMAFLDSLFDGDAKYQTYEPRSRYTDGSGLPQYNYAGNVSGSFRDQISSRESGGNYQAKSPNSSARGKYQFIWSIHKDQIAKQTGARSEQEFMNNPQAQEQYFDYWDQTTLNPSAQANLNKFREYYPDATVDDVKKATHFAGRGGLEKALRAGTLTKPIDANGTSIDKYVYKMK